MRIGIIGGTFNPIHYGHLFAAEEVYHRFGLGRVIFVPSYQPPHKACQVAPARDRFLMTELAISSNPHFKISDIEIDRAGKSYTIDTVKSFKETYGRKAQIYFITGADAILDIGTWKDFRQLLKLCQFVALTRPGYNLEKLEKSLLGEIILVELPALAISGTDIRRRLKEGKPIKYLVPECVEDYIYKHGLYRETIRAHS